MRIVFLTHYYPPEAGAPQARIAAVARGLAGRGHEVTVHTGFPNYPDGRIHAPYRNRPLQREEAGGVRVVRSAVYAAPNTGFVKRLANHLSFAVSALATGPAAGAADVVVVESPPLFTAGAAVPYAAAKRAGLVVNVADRWPASAVELGMLRNKSAIRAASALEERIYRAADVVTVPTRGLERDLGGLPVATGKVMRIGPAVDLERFDPAPPERRGAPLRVLYAGTVGLAQGLETLLEAAALAGPERVQVRIAGGGASAEAVARAAPANVEVLGVVEPDGIPALYREAEAAVVLLRDLPIFAGALPTKIAEAMAAGRPVIVAARGEAAEFTTAAGAGIAVPPEDPQQLATAFHRLQAARSIGERMGAAGRALAEHELGREASLDHWERALGRAAS